MFREIIFAGCVEYPIFNLPLQYRITKNRSRLLRTEPPAYLLRPGVHLFQRHLRRTITKSVYIAIISRLVGYFLNNYAFHILTLCKPLKCDVVNVVLFSGNIKFNHSVVVTDVVYCNGRVWFPRQLVKTVLNFPVSLRELRTVGLVIIKGYF